VTGTPSPEREIVLFIDRGFPLEPFASALGAELDCRERVRTGERNRVAAIVTGAEPVGAAEIEPHPGLRLVLTCSIGVDHLDLDALRKRGVTVCNTPTYCTEEVADHALACVLGGWRGLWTLGEDVRAGAWEPGTMLRRFDAQRLGVVGLGRIGSALARRARALGIEVVGFDPFAATLPEGVTPVSFDELLSGSDAVSLHAPGGTGGRPLIGERELERFKPGAVLVNLARASLVDVDAVVAALETEALSAAALDVWPREPPASGDSRLGTRGLLVTPHVGWSSPEADAAYRDEAIEALRAALIDRREPAGIVGTTL
jgi:D-3-phosphoglycerate dehydrogenase / 2-oxoglutarate reductase